jgi:hypothetical protein
MDQNLPTIWAKVEELSKKRIKNEFRKISMQ